MRVMRTLYVADHSARLRIRKGNLVVERSDEATRVPLEVLEAVVLLGRAEVSNDTLGTLVRNGIRLSALSKTGRLRFYIGGPTQGNVMLRLAQYRAATDPEQTIRIAKLIVAGKLQNCNRSMHRWAWDAEGRVSRSVITREREAVADRISDLGTALDGDTIRGIEGDGTRRYFKALSLHLHESESSLSFTTRSRRPPRDKINCLLSFTYGLVLTEVIGGLESVGLDPQVGFLHRPRPGRASLGLDLLEELRPSVADRFVVACVTRRQIDEADFERKAGKAVYLSEDGRRKLLGLYDQFRQSDVRHPLLDRSLSAALLPSVQATLMARYLRGDLPSYPPYTLVA